MSFDLASLGRNLAATLPILAFALLNARNNLKKPIRSRQILMPILALVYCVLLMIWLDKAAAFVMDLVTRILGMLSGLGLLLGGLGLGFLSNLGMGMSSGLLNLQSLMQRVNLGFILYSLANTGFMLGYMAVKRVLLSIFKRTFKDGNLVYETLILPFYEKDETSGNYHVKRHFGQLRTFMKVMYYGAAGLSCGLGVICLDLYRDGALEMPFYPVFGIILIGEIYFALDGLTKQEMDELISGEGDEAKTIVSYSLLRGALRKYFGDKLEAEDTTVNAGAATAATLDELIKDLRDDPDYAREAYGILLDKRRTEGMELDRSLLAAGTALLDGKSVLFSTPFYYDLIPYAFYPMNQVLMKHHKVLVVLGRHDIEAEVARYLEQGIRSVTNVPDLWRIGVLDDAVVDAGNPPASERLDIGILSRSAVNDLTVHERNRDFFEATDMVFIIEPSRLVTTAQVGLYSVVRSLRDAGRRPVYLSTDRNCDGLVDALSHILMTPLTQVQATEHHKGASSYMLWQADGEPMQHRLVPGLTRYLGLGTELSFAALKNQVSRTKWYGGDAFPVTDVQWIAEQYYYDLMSFAQRSPDQQAMEECFVTEPNLWDARREKNAFMTVEDEFFNMFELRRLFATRAKEQGFINLLSSDYLLNDYMAENESIFNADPKAIPYVAADYAHTPRNVVLRLLLRLSVGSVSESEIARELLLIDRSGEDTVAVFWNLVCEHFAPALAKKQDALGQQVLEMADGEAIRNFTAEVLRKRRRYNEKTSAMETVYSIEDPVFIRLTLSDLQPARLIAEEEQGEGNFLGTELRGHVYQRMLPGQFFTFGGRYYEMLRVAADGQVVVRRAADHIDGRVSYRNIRSFGLSAVRDSSVMGEVMKLGEMKVSIQYADVTVRTDGYYRMERHQDFAGARRVELTGIPERVYYNKPLLRIELPEADAGVTHTLTVLMNEIFRTLFAENQPYITAVCAGAQIPLTDTIDGISEPNVIYVLEDSLLDIGLLEAVRRNLDRILELGCDYLHWHAEAVEKSLNPPPKPQVPDYTLPPEQQEEEKEKQKLGSRIKRFFGRIKDWFVGLFKRKKKGETPEDAPGEVPSEVPTEGGSEGTAGVGTEPEAPEVPVPEGATGAAVPTEEPVNAMPGSGAPNAEDNAGSEETADGYTVMSMAMPEAEEPTKVGSAEIEFEGDEARPAAEPMVRLPYHQRFYLLYGYSEVPEFLHLAETAAYLDQLGYENSHLSKARKGRSIAEMIERSYDPDQAGHHYCDFCGTELIGTEYEVLSDGRERCIACSRTAVRTEAEFKEIFQEVVRYMEAFYGIKLSVPVKVKMVSTSKVQKAAKRSFVPTGGFDGRALGVAVRNRDGMSILLENGAPRIQSMMTMAHELTHIWQYSNWDEKALLTLYGQAMRQELYEGMAMWSEIQYAYLIGETAAAKREEIRTVRRDDEYGRGFIKYAAKYPISEEGMPEKTPFEDTEKPL